MQNKGFTIVELLIVIVVIAILAAITIVSYNGIADQAETSALKENLRNASKLIETDKVDRGTYSPTFEAIAGTERFQSNGYSYSYESDGLTYCVEAKKISKPNNVFFINSKNGSLSPEKGTCGGVAISDLQTNSLQSYSVANSISVSDDLSKIFVPNGYSFNYSYNYGADWTDLLAEGPLSSTFEEESYNNPDPTYGPYSISNTGISKNGSYAWMVRDYNQNQSMCATRLQPSGNLWASSSTAASNCNATRTNWAIGDVAVSNNGSVIALADLDTSQVKLSRDSGATWSQVNVCNCGGGSIGNLRMTPDGAKFVVHHSGRLSFSVDGGQTWDSRAVPQSRSNWSSGTLALSADGSTIVFSAPDDPRANAIADGVHVSRDGGQTWTERMNSPKLFWRSINVSANGKNMVGIASNDPSSSNSQRDVYVSNNYGETWKKLSELGTHRWLHTFISADGTKALAIKVQTNGTTDIYRWSM